MTGTYKNKLVPVPQALIPRAPSNGYPIVTQNHGSCSSVTLAILKKLILLSLISWTWQPFAKFQHMVVDWLHSSVCTCVCLCVWMWLCATVDVMWKSEDLRWQCKLSTWRQDLLVIAFHFGRAALWASGSPASHYQLPVGVSWDCRYAHPSIQLLQGPCVVRSLWQVLYPLQPLSIV